jgi:SAM-dependent methyltransferase
MIPVADSQTCHACGLGPLEIFADIGEVPVLCGVHWADARAAASSPAGRIRLARCPECAYVRNVAFEPELMVYDTTMDTNLHHSPAFQVFSADLAEHLTSRYPLAGATVLDIGCGQGEFLRELCHAAECRGMGYDAMYAGQEGPDASGATFFSRHAPRGDELAKFDFVTSRHWFEHLPDPYEFLTDLRAHAGERTVFGYIEVPDAGYDLSTAGWEVIYPHVSYFDGFALRAILERAGWTVEDSGTLFSGMFRFIEFSANSPDPRRGANRLPDEAERDRQLEAIDAFGPRHHAEREAWQRRIADLVSDGARPVLWGAGSRGVQFLSFADPDHRLAAVVDVNPRKWGRYLPITAHRVDDPASLTGLAPRSVIITNPAYRDEVSSSLAALGVNAEVLVA